MKTLEHHLARHCAPTVMGVKAGSLVSLSREEFPALPVQAADYQTRFSPCGLAFTVLHETARRSLLYVYRPRMLRKKLSEGPTTALLRRCGYRPEEGLEAMIDHLRHRIGEEGEFPHEIGLFLDYPTEDVEAFIETRGAGCKLCGYWKVYHDVDAAKERFACFDACRACLCNVLNTGGSIAELLTA